MILILLRAIEFIIVVGGAFFFGFGWGILALICMLFWTFASYEVKANLSCVIAVLLLVVIIVGGAFTQGFSYGILALGWVLFLSLASLACA